MFVALTLASVLFQGAAPPKQTESAVIDELIRKTNELKAFVAEYRLTDGKDEQVLRFSFRAPGDMKVELPGPSIMCARDGVLEIRGTRSDGKSTTAHVEADSPIAFRHGRLTERVRSEFPTASEAWSEKIECGPQLNLTISPDPKESKREQFNFGVAYQFTGGPVLGWLDSLKKLDVQPFEQGDHLMFRTSRGSELTVSKKTGFLESLVKGDSRLRLEHLELDPKWDGDSFAVPDPVPDAQDLSQQFITQWERNVTIVERLQVLRWLSGSAASGALKWDRDTHAHVLKIFECLYADGIPLDFAEWIANTKKWIDRRGTKFGERYESLAKDEIAKRDGVDAEVHQLRGEVQEHLDSLLHDCLSNLAIESESVPDPELRRNLDEVQHAAFSAEFKDTLAQPLLDAFDEVVERAQNGR